MEWEDYSLHTIYFHVWMDGWMVGISVVKVTAGQHQGAVVNRRVSGLFYRLTGLFYRQSQQDLPDAAFNMLT